MQTRLNVKYISLCDLREYENNPRINDKAVEAVAESIKQFGFRVPVVIDKNNVIIAGHTRVKAAKRLDMSSVPCVVADDLTPEQVKAYRLADNKTAELAEWDIGALEKELADLTAFDMDAFGFETLTEIMKEFDDINEYDFTDDISPEESEAKTKRGDIWLLGRHRLMCGSSTNIDDVKNLMDGEKAKILFTSPPYSDMREYEGGKNLDVSHIASFISAYKDFAEYQCVNLGIQRKNNEIVQYWDKYISVAKDCGYKLMAWNIWDKNTAGSIGQQNAFFPIRHEWIFVFGNEFFGLNKTWKKKKESINIKGKRVVRQTDGKMKYSSRGDTSNPFKKMESVISLYCERKNKTDHPAVFPVELPAEYIKAMTDKNDNVIEAFGGSGSTLIACERLDRNCYAMELEPKYCDIIIKRWEEMTGEKAVLTNDFASAC